MNKLYRGEYDNYNYRSAENMSLSEQLQSAKDALSSAIRLSQNSKNDYWDKKKAEIKDRIQQLEAQV